ncbi:MAG: hypothetical protein GY730_01030 [bacterium]|nr:hypothetical protein [bacterium]
MVTEKNFGKIMPIFFTVFIFFSGMCYSDTTVNESQTQQELSSSHETGVEEEIEVEVMSKVLNSEDNILFLNKLGVKVKISVSTFKNNEYFTLIEGITGENIEDNKDIFNKGSVIPLKLFEVIGEENAEVYALDIAVTYDLSELPEEIIEQDLDIFHFQTKTGEWSSLDAKLDSSVNVLSATADNTGIYCLAVKSAILFEDNAVQLDNKKGKSCFSSCKTKYPLGKWKKKCIRYWGCSRCGWKPCCSWKKKCVKVWVPYPKNMAKRLTCYAKCRCPKSLARCAYYAHQVSKCAFACAAVETGASVIPCAICIVDNAKNGGKKIQACEDVYKYCR